MGRVVHLNNLGQMPDVEVAALAESDPNLRELARRQAPRARVFADYRELMEGAGLDAVVISLPNAMHADAAIAALQRGLHVYLEKPLATDLAEANKLLRAWRESGRQAMIGFNYRFNPLHQEARKQIQSGRLGNLVAARSVFTTASHRLPEWKRTRQGGGGVLLDLASHHVDLVRYWFNERITDVNASVKSQQVENDCASVDLRLANGLLVQSFFCMNSVDDDRFEVYGSSAKLSLDRYRSWSVEITASSRSTLSDRLRQMLALFPRSSFAIKKILSQGNEPSFAAALRHFVDAVRSNTQAFPDLADGFESLAVIIAAEESARLGHAVKVPFIQN
jgi:predicted dehydrogenase